MVGRRFSLGAGVGAVLVLIGAVVSGQAQRSPATLDDLLVEIRGLRADLSQTAAATMRVQMLTARLSLQEQRITAVANQRADVSARLAAAVLDRAQVEARVKQLQTTIPNTPPEIRRELEPELSAETIKLAQRLDAERQL